MSDPLLSHGYICLANDPVLRVAYQVSDATIWLSYCGISALMFYFSSGEPRLRNTIFVLFIIFIFLCGQGHLFDVLNKMSLNPTTHTWLYRIDGYGSRVATAIASALTLGVLFVLRRPIRKTLHGLVRP